MRKVSLIRTAVIAFGIALAAAGCAAPSAAGTSADVSSAAEEALSEGQMPETELQERPEGAPGDAPDGERPEKPDGGPGEMPGGNGGPGGAPEGMPGGNGGSGAPESYEAVTAVTEDTEITDEEITSDGTDENAVLVSDGAAADLSGVTIYRESADSTGGDSSSFYGVGAAVLVTDGTVTVSDSVIDTDARGGAGVFAYGDGTAYVSDTEITTQQSTSGGIHAAGGGTLYAWDLTVETNGESSAAIRSDRGGGTMIVDGGSYTSNGTGSPAVYSTADITIHNAQLTATGSEAVCIEGLNSLRLYDCTLSGNMPVNEQNDCTWNVILYQSMSGDSEVGCSTFIMDGGELITNNGGVFYTTNTESEFIIRDVDITYPDDCPFFLKVTGNANRRGWGSAGENGADTVFTAIAQEIKGDVIWDSISMLDLYLTEGTSFTGAVIDDESNAGNGTAGNGYCSVYISSDSVWTVTGDSTVTNLYNAGTVTDADGNTVTIMDTDGNVLVSGDSAYTVTVSAYAEEADLSGAGTVPDYSEFQVEK